MDRKPQADIHALEQELTNAVGPFMPVNVAITRLCEAAIRAAQDKEEWHGLVTCTAVRNVCERGLRERGTSAADLKRISDRAVGVIAARLMA
ncbi:hypothetical protein [Geminicoccus flavidas]|uniref:hypothetical protein n=1 Tax=Geminicoccus flavidas TaxID=2506407 RepID=UPI0013581482|nr:hypothetical protein [Geminicoccus flavidas]